MVLHEKASQEYSVNTGVPQGSSLCLTPFLLYINDLLDVICNIGIHTDNTKLYCKEDQACNLWQQLELTSVLKSDLRDIVDWCRKFLVDFNAGKTQLASFEQSNDSRAINVKCDGPVLQEKSPIKMLLLSFFSKLDWGSCIFSIAKTATKEIGTFICAIKHLSPEVVHYLYLQINMGMLDKLQKQVCRTFGTSPSASLEPLDHLRNETSEWVKALQLESEGSRFKPH